MKNAHRSGFKGLVLGIVTCLLLSTQAARAGFVFAEPTKVPCPGVSEVAYPQISRDGLELYFMNMEGMCTDIWVMRRSSTQEDWDAPVKLAPPVNSHWAEAASCISSDGLELYFSDAVYDLSGCTPFPGGYGQGDLWVCRRASKEDSWGDPENLGPVVNTEDDENAPSLSANGLSLYYQVNRLEGHGAYDLYVTTRLSTNEPWGPPENVGTPVNSSILEATPFISADGLSLFFSRIPWGLARADLYVSQRQTVSSPWGPPVLFAPTQMAGLEFNLSFSENDSTLYFCNSDGFYNLYDLWKVDVTVVVDFNEDGQVDGSDVLALVLNWGDIPGGAGTSAYDIAPFPCGDGIVDGRDLEVLYKHADASLIVLPTPAYRQLDVAPAASLSWTPGAFADTFDIYLGTSYADVNNASRDNPMGVLVSESQDANTYDPLEPLDFARTYYWRIDEANALSDPAIVKGLVWSFTTAPLACPIENIVATASSAREGNSPENTINGSGLNAYYEHSVHSDTMWFSEADGPQPTWIQYEFDAVYPLHAMLVWNFNSEHEYLLGHGLKEVTIEYSEDGIGWITFDNMEFLQGASRDDYGYNTIVDFGGIVTKYVRLTAQSNWGGSSQYGLSEVCFFYVPPVTDE